MVFLNQGGEQVRNEEKKKKRSFLQKIIGTVLALTILTGGIVYYWTSASPDTRPIIQAKTVKQIMDELTNVNAILLSGKVEPKTVSKLFLSQERGKVASIDVNEGDHVEVGQKLFTYTNPEGDMAIREAELAVKSEESTLNQKQTDLNQKYTQIQNKKNQLQKAVNRYQQADAETKKEIESEKNSLEETVNQLQADINSGTNEVTTTQLSLEKAQASYELTKQKYENKEVVSEISGIIKKIDRDQVEKAVNQNNTSNPFMEIFDTSELYATGTVNEFQKEKIQSLPNVAFMDRNDEEKIWSGKIVKVEDIGEGNDGDDANQNMTKYKYRAKLDPNDSLPTIGKHVFVKTIPEKLNEIMLPKEAVMEESGKYSVWKIKGNKLKKTSISAEKTVDGQIQVKSGLIESDRIAFPMKGMKEGMEVGKHLNT